ncbi:hypothetical protein MELB17_14321 [Marinobacter sp. ELB17]|nr:hypothetical protein MELB17_14321 [Marinobacter sp. ELB17]
MLPIKRAVIYSLLTRYFLVATGLVSSLVFAQLLTSEEIGPFQLITAGTLVVLALTLAGHLYDNRNQLPIWIATHYYFVVVNGYAVRGIVKTLQGRVRVTWNGARPGQEQR